MLISLDVEEVVRILPPDTSRRRTPVPALPVKPLPV
jgi:hypothetical protein